MKFYRNEKGNIILNTLIVVSLFALAYVWYAKQPDTGNLQVVTNEALEQESETVTNDQGGLAEDVVSTFQNIGAKAVGNNEQQLEKEESVPAPLNSVILAETETGNFVTIAYANLTQPGFIALYKVNSNSETLPIGHTDLLPPTIISNLKLEINTVVAEKQTIVAVLHQDDGDGVFEFPESDPYLKNGDFIVSDVDVVEIRAEREAKNLKAQIDTYLENNF
jgi:hypothetical protein